jgi:predicted transposase YbfD/YdcC
MRRTNAELHRYQHIIRCNLSCQYIAEITQGYRIIIPAIIVGRLNKFCSKGFILNLNVESPFITTGGLLMASRFHSGVVSYFEDIPDPRIERTKRYSLTDLLFVALCAVICGADSCADMEYFARVRVSWLEEHLGVADFTPSHDTFSRIFSLLDPEPLNRCFIAWTEAMRDASQGEIIAVDGKQMRRSFDRVNKQHALYLVSAWACNNALVLGQVQVAEKSNEMTAVPRLLEMIDIRGAIVTVDALNTQKEIASTIIDRKGQYVLALKANHPDLFDDVRVYLDSERERHFETAPHSSIRTTDHEHGRREVRRCYCVETKTLDFLRGKDDWKGLQSIACVESKRTFDGKTTTERRYYLSSLPADAKVILNAVRAHWGIENKLHWVLDMTFDEDRSRTRKDHGPQNLALMRKIAMNLYRRNTRKACLRLKKMHAVWDQDYVLELLID